MAGVASATDAKGTTWAIPTTWPNGPGVASKDNGPIGVSVTIPTTALILLSP